jgi:predicted DNA-binding transcriptional regulator YafY
MTKRGSAQTDASRMLARQWQLLLAIQGSRAGVGVAQLVEETGIKRATAYRDLDALIHAGIPLQVFKKDRVKHYRFLRSSELPAMNLSALQIAALHLARQELQPLAGAALVRELDAFLHKLRPIEPQQSFRFASRAAGQPDLLKVVDRSLRSGKRARIEYRAASRNGTPTLVNIEPLLLSVAEGVPYLRAYCVERGEERTYKLARIIQFELTEEPALYRPAHAPSAAFTHSVKAWSGQTATVKIKLDPDVAWRAHEYPLVLDQKLVPARDGSVVVEARVAGIVEATRWVLSWGGAAEALEPPELRSAARKELAQALGKYDGPGPVKATPREKTTGRGTTRLNRSENRRA